MSDNIKRLVSVGVAWTYAERMLSQAISLVISVILARLLEPSDYAVIAVVNIFISIASVFATSGFGSSLVQKKGADELDYSTTMWFSLFIAMVFYAILYIAAPLFAVYYEMDELVPVLRVLAITIPLGSFSSVQQAYVQRDMAFKRFFLSTLLGLVISGTVGVLMAYHSYGVWALVTQTMIARVVNIVVLQCTINWRPRFIYSWSRMKMLMGFGIKILGTQLLYTSYSTASSLIIAKRYSTEDLAFYNKGTVFPQMIVNNIDTSITKVLFPAIARYQNDVETIKQMVRRSVSISTFLLAPLMIGLIAVAPVFVRVFLTEKWMPCVPYLRVLCVVWLLQPMQTCVIQAIKAIGKSGLLFRLELIKKVIGIIILLMAVFFFDSPIAIATALIVNQAIAILINMPILVRLFRYSILEQLRDYIMSILLSLVMWGAIYAVSFLFANMYVSLVVQILTGVITYLAEAWLSKSKEFRYVLNTIREMRHKKSRSTM